MLVAASSSAAADDGDDDEDDDDNNHRNDQFVIWICSVFSVAESVHLRVRADSDGHLHREMDGHLSALHVPPDRRPGTPHHRRCLAAVSSLCHT